ncbi:MAG: hypothetical protein ACT4QF_02480 [Sporichthyaceae bacterium]
MTTTTTQNHRNVNAAIGTTDGLFDALVDIQDEGWDGPTGRAVLEYARTAIVARAVRSAGFTGADAEYAEATGWAAAWKAMTSRPIRSAESPWGVVTAAVRSAVLNEKIAATYGTDARSAWRVHRFKQAHLAEGRTARGDWTSVADPAALARPVSYSALVDAGFEQPAPSAAADTAGGWVEEIVDLLARHGWENATAREAVLHVSEHARPNPTGGAPKAHGWREMALELGLPAWRARRVTVLLLGTASWPGLVERIAADGPDALNTPAVQAAVRATCVEQMRPPARSALAVDAFCGRAQALAG